MFPSGHLDLGVVRSFSAEVAFFVCVVVEAALETKGIGFISWDPYERTAIHSDIAVHGIKHIFFRTEGDVGPRPL